VALLLDAMAGPVVGEPYGLPPPAAAFGEACRLRPRGLRLAYWTGGPSTHLDPEVERQFLAALGTLETIGHDLRKADPGLGCLAGVVRTILAGNTAALAGQVPPARVDELEPSTVLLMLEGTRCSAADYCTAVDTARTEAARIMAFWQDYDFLLTPALTRLPPALGTMPSAWDLDTIWDEYLDWLAFLHPFNVTGQPAISIPCGWTSSGLPVGLQVVGRYGDDAGVLSLASAFEEARPWHDRRPAVPGSSGASA
jgi:amidase/aspartyl-tRNA(Asn)/glutamyl-tRNA(Gln) amidotransferase subunit A